ncbi:MAG: hypothetical protein IPP90_11065 [Gemmatimonadaceae bacterium]|nr:hypothetical protein [Gemmatimonadaceae bacterium]
MMFDAAWRETRKDQALVRFERLRLLGHRRYMVRESLRQAVVFAIVMLGLQAWWIYSEGRALPSVTRIVIMVTYFLGAGLLVGFFSSRLQWRVLTAMGESRLHGETVEQQRVRSREATGRPVMIFGIMAAIAMGTLAVVVALETGEIWMWLWGACCLAGAVYYAVELTRFAPPRDA